MTLHSFKEEEGEFVIVRDSMGISMRGQILKRHMGRLLINFCNWESKFDEWIEEQGSGRLRPWKNPFLGSWNPLRMTRKHIAAAKLEVMLLLRTGFVAFARDDFI